MSLEAPIIFYLVLEETLPKNFYIFDRLFKEQNCMLVPVKIDQLQSLSTSTEQSQIIVISSVTDSRELKIFNEKIRPLLKFVLKSKRLNYFQLSSFSKINDTRMFAMRKNYFFMRYPIDARIFSKKIVRYHILKSEQNLRWPGGRRAGVTPMAV